MNHFFMKLALFNLCQYYCDKFHLLQAEKRAANLVACTQKLM